MASQVYTEEQLNYFRICYISTDILPQGLRTIFKQEWDNRYKATYGEWKDIPKNGLDFKSGETPARQRRNARLLATMINGKRCEWDCTMLFYAILHSDSIHGLDPVIRSSVDDIREFRNEDFAHMPHGQLSDLKFRVAVRKVELAFQSLGLSTADIQNVSKQKTFPTNELQTVMKKVENLKQELQKTDAKLQCSEEQRQILAEQLQHEAKSFCVIPPKPPHQIAGREYEVARIEKELSNLRNDNQNSLSYCYISGNPGSGKSQLASLVAEKVYEEAIKDPSALSFVMTLNAENAETLLESYVSLARKIKCPEYTVTNTQTSEDMKIEEKIRNLKDLITTKLHHYTRWLLVVDNVTSVSRMQGFLPEPGNQQWGKGQLLITTQDSFCIPPDSSFISHISVSKGMVPSDAAYLLAMVSGINDPDMEDKVAKALDYQPLALASAATYVKQVRTLSPSFEWKDYVEKLEQGKRAPTENTLSKTNPSYPYSMTVATRIAVERAMNSDEVTKRAFTFLGLCAPQLLRLDILTNYILNTGKDQDKEEIGIQIQGSSLILTGKEEDGVYIRLHQVVHDIVKLVVKDFIKADEQARAVDIAVRSFNQFIETIPRDGTSRIYVAERLHFVPHLKTLSVEIESVFSTEEKYQFFKHSMLDFNVVPYPSQLQRLGNICQFHSEFFAAKDYFRAAVKLIEGSEISWDGEIVASGYIDLGHANYKLGNHQQAKENYERALSIRLKKLGPEHTDVASTLDNLGNLHIAMGNHLQAKEYFERAWSIQLKKLGPEHNDVARTLHNLGNLHHATGNHQQAKEYYERALSIQLKTLGEEHTVVAATLHNIGSLHKAKDNHQQAKEYYERALSIQLKKLGEEHTEVAGTLHNLGNLHKAMGNHQQAKEYYERALSIQLKKLGAEHTDVARTLHNLGNLHSAMGNHQQAKEYYERALSIQLKKLGAEHTDVARTLHNLGNLHSAMGNHQQAKEYYERALSIQLKKLGAEHTDVARTLHNLRNLHSAMGNHQQAKEYYERVLSIQLKKLGEEHTEVADTLHNLGNLHSEMGNHQQATEYYERALSIQVKKLGPEHTDVVRTLHNLGHLHSEMGNHQQATEYYERALSIQLKKLGEEHTDVALTLHNLGNLRNAMGNHQQAKEYYERALSIQLKKLGEEHIEVARTLHNLGVLHKAMGNHQQAKENFERALSIQLKKLGPEHTDVALTIHNLGVLHKAVGNHQQAKEYYERALSIRLKKLGPEHTDVAPTLHNLGHLHSAMGNHQQAKEYYERAVSIQLKKLGPEHTDVALTLHNLGNLRNAMGNHQQAKEYYERALSIQLKKLGEDHIEVARTLHNLGVLHKAMGNHQQAKEYCERALSIQLKKLGPEHTDVHLPSGRTYPPQLRCPTQSSG